MIEILPADGRGRTEMSWLDSRHSFSFGDYYDPRRMGFGALRVLNDDRVRPGAGFGTHPHANMEILTYVLEGQLAHEDSTGNAFVIRPGDVQRMSAGTGVTHSELNPSDTEPVHFLQAWIVPEWRGLPPSYEQRMFPESARRKGLVRVASRSGLNGSVAVHQDVNLWAALLGEGETRTLPIPPGRRAWLHLARGRLEVNGKAAGEGDGLAITGESLLRITGAAPASELLVFEMA